MLSACVALLLGGQPTDTGCIKKVEGEDTIEFQVSLNLCKLSA